MKIRNKEILLILVMFLLVFTVEAQKSGIEPVSLGVNVDDEIDTVINTELVNIRVSVRSSKKGYLKTLSPENFEIYDAKTLQKVEFLNFDESTNEYNVGYLPDIPATDRKRREVRLRIKLSAGEKKEFGKITVDKQKWILSERN